MQKSYFDFIFPIRKENYNFVSIAGKKPNWYIGREYKILAPKYWFFAKYKKDHNTEYYTEQFTKEVLNKLNPYKIYEDLGKDAILLCYEKPELFCHRHLVSKWLEDRLGIEIKEFS